MSTLHLSRTYPAGSGVYIRFLAPADASAYKALRDALLLCAPTAFTSDHAASVVLPASQFTARLGTPEDGVFYLGAFDAAGHLLGCVGCERAQRAKERHRANVIGMMVTPAAQGQGIGRRLLAACLAAAARMEGLQQLDLTVTAGNASAQRLYEEAGFRAWGTHPNAIVVDGVACDKVHMQLRLPPALMESPIENP